MVVVVVPVEVGCDTDASDDRLDEGEDGVDDEVDVDSPLLPCVGMHWRCGTCCWLRLLRCEESFDFKTLDVEADMEGDVIVDAFVCNDAADDAMAEAAARAAAADNCGWNTFLALTTGAKWAGLANGLARAANPPGKSALASELRNNCDMA